jgi:ABC-type lipoprotein export system ATPase subunit
MERKDQILVSADKTMSEKEILLRVDNVSRTYQTPGGDVHALYKVYMEVPRGSIIALKGRSGSGKTTLINIIGGLDRPTVGEVVFEGQRLGGLNDEALTNLRCAQIGFVFQSFALLPTFSAFENVEFALRLADQPLEYARRRALQCLKVVGLANRRNSRPDELSGGQQQRVAIARALANQPTLILADEPTGELDTGTSRQILHLFRSLVEHEGNTILVASHDPLVEEVADQVFELMDGRIAN